MLAQGQVVYDKCGRNKGKIFLVSSVDSEYVYICDGDCRKLDNPKKKKIKHIQVTNNIEEEIKAKLETNAYLLDAEIRKALSAYKVC